MAIELRDAPRPAAEEASLEELEALWKASSDPTHEADAPARRRAAYAVLARALAWGWPSVLVAIFVLAPAPAPDQTYAGWVVGASVAIVLGPFVAGLLARSGWTTPALGLSGTLGALGIAVGIACRATAHHTGSWWIAETAMFTALTAVSLACLAVRARS